MDTPLIEFHRVSPVECPTPRPAAESPPDYLPSLPADPYSVPGRPRSSLLAAASLGFQIPLTYDVRFAAHIDGSITVQGAGLPVQSQLPEQVQDSPMQGRHIVKFINPWIIQTPPECSTLILPALNRFHLPVEVLAGLIESDTWYREVLFPSLCTVPRGQTIAIASGIPLTQAIPVPRRRWESSINPTLTPEEGVIAFHSTSPADAIAPQPAMRHLPDWLKQMPPDRTTPDRQHTFGTVKKCPPFIEALSMGYLIPIEHDLELTLHGSSELSFRSTGDILDAAPLQYPGAPFQNVAVLRIRIPWRIQTPPGYSTLILPVLNRFETPLQALAGLIDTDTDTDELVIPLLCLMTPGSQFLLPRGSAIAQIIPIKRQSWRHTCVPMDETRRQEMEHRFEHNEHAYRDEHWKRKSYT